MGITKIGNCETPKVKPLHWAAKRLRTTFESAFSSGGGSVSWSAVFDSQQPASLLAQHEGIADACLVRQLPQHFVSALSSLALSFLGLETTLLAQQDLVEVDLQQLIFASDGSARTAYEGGVTPRFFAHSSLWVGVMQQQFVQHFSGPSHPHGQFSQG